MNSNPRVFLWIGLLFLGYLNYEAWMRDYGPKPQSAAEVAAARQDEAVRKAELESSIPMAVPTVVPTDDVPQAAAAPQPVTAGAVAPAAGSVRVRTDVLDLDIGLAGGELQRADLIAYPVVKSAAARVRLFNREAGDGVYVLQSGLTGPQGAERPTHLAIWSAAADRFELGGRDDVVRVPLTWSDGAGVTVTKTFVFTRGSYRVLLEYTVENRSAEPWAAASYAQLLRDNVPIDRSMFSPDSYAFKGPAYYDGLKYQKLELDDKEDRSLDREITGGWLAGMQHHFVTAIVPPVDAPNRYTLRVDGQQFLLGTLGPTREVAAGATGTYTETLFVGPKLQAQLEETGPRLDLVADYGVLTLLSKPLFVLLEWLHGLVGNWGWAIIFATFILKLVFYPLSEAAGKSMAKMKTLAPRIKNLQETYKDDREKLGRAMMEMYQREKINPVSGCLPILIQMPVFLAFYWVLLESVEMRQAPFMGWINDLSSKDPFFVLPAIMAAAMYGQFKLNPTPPDPIQAKVFAVMPFAMSIMFAFFPAGLVLYWVTNTLLSIAQQWNINRRIEAQMKKA